MAIQEYSKYHITAFWTPESYQHLEYIQEEFNDPDSLAQWLSVGYPNRFTGDMCDMRSPQPMWNDRIIRTFTKFGWQDIGTSYYRMNPGTVLPTHKDLYKKYIEIFNLQGQEQYIRRAIIFLENWQSGHYLEICGDVITDWTAGTVIEWAYDAPHLAANIGLTPRYTLQVTGHL
jgi:hypothetical protein